MKTGTGIATAGLMIALALLMQGSNHHRYQLKHDSSVFDSHTGNVITWDPDPANSSFIEHNFKDKTKCTYYSSVVLKGYSSGKHCLTYGDK